MLRPALLGALAVALGAVPATAQGGFQTLDPSYGGETARRAFYGGFALSGEAAYRDADLLGLADAGAPAGAVALSGRLDYALLPQVDLSLVADFSGGVGRGPLGLSWVVVKPYWHNEMTDYAVRLAVDPAAEGRLGFRQTDVSFLSTTALSPEVTSDFSLGVRRVRTGYIDALALDEQAFGVRSTPGLPDPDAPTDGPSGPVLAALATDPAGVRLVGQELRASWGYNVLFDPAGSRLAFGLTGEVGDYALVSSGTDAPDGGETAGVERIQSGIGWARAGLEFSRPTYQLAPFLSVPLVTWATVRGEPVRHGPRPEKLRLGLRVTLR
jgi:hypothetical protein